MLCILGQAKFRNNPWNLQCSVKFNLKKFMKKLFVPLSYSNKVDITHFKTEDFDKYVFRKYVKIMYNILPIDS